MSSSLGISPLRRSPGQRDIPAVSPCAPSPLAAAPKGAGTQQAVRCPNVGVLLGHGRGQMLGAEPLHLLVAAAHLGDAMSGMCSQGQRSCAGLPASGVELALAGEKSCQGCVSTAGGGELLLWQRCCSDLSGQIVHRGHKGRRMWSVRAFLGPCQGLHLSHCSLEPSTHL